VAQCRSQQLRRSHRTHLKMRLAQVGLNQVGATRNEMPTATTRRSRFARLAPPCLNVPTVSIPDSIGHCRGGVAPRAPARPLNIRHSTDPPVVSASAEEATATAPNGEFTGAVNVDRVILIASPHLHCDPLTTMSPGNLVSRGCTAERRRLLGSPRVRACNVFGGCKAGGARSPGSLGRDFLSSRSESGSRLTTDPGWHVTATSRVIAGLVTCAGIQLLELPVGGREWSWVLAGRGPVVAAT